MDITKFSDGFPDGPIPDPCGSTGLFKNLCKRMLSFDFSIVGSPGCTLSTCTFPCPRLVYAPSTVEMMAGRGTAASLGT